MGNINDYALAQFKDILDINGNSEDTTYLRMIRAAIRYIDRIIHKGFTVTAAGTSYTLAPDPGDETSTLWDAIAWRAVWQYTFKSDREFSDELAGAARISDSIQTIDRRGTMMAKKELREEARREYRSALFEYSTTDTDTTPSISEVGTRESAPV